VQLQWEELHQWGPMVETPSTLEKGCGQYICGGIYVVAMLNIRKDFSSHVHGCLELYILRI
jgi:hypothetical protein